MKFKHKKEIEDKFFKFDKNNFTPTEKYYPILQRIGLALYYFINCHTISPRAMERLEGYVNCDILLTPMPDYGDENYHYLYLAAYPRNDFRYFLFNQKIELFSI